MRLPFTVVHSDSEAKDFPAANLHDVTPHNPGWRSAAFPLYPQEIVIAFTGAVSIRSLKILSHELFVTSKVHVSVGQVSKHEVANHRTAKFKYLGFVRFKDNGEWKLREQQTIQINSAGTFLKLSFEIPYSHAKNLCNQVGVVDMAVEGDVDLVASTQVLKAGQQGLDFVMLTHGIDLDDDFVHAEAQSEGISVDAVRMLRRVVSLKAHAQVREDFDEAQRLCKIENDIAEAGRSLEQAEAHKAAAVAREDYAAAKELKIKTDELKLSLRKMLDLIQKR